ncbi:hypothetical protein A447_07736 [Fusobacterium vincentii ATCC 51190]|jgi:hypothetical protein|uniref:DUF421 domain-containing protein n=4 Tax=Fusobacterium TaxID=848 RepID=A0AAJ1FNY4_FUSVC|nr:MULTISPECIES: DUF421 domain-containing protein [Fusobacterium]EAA23624.1 Hypothetical Membrane Spanning Protein [Fusobacterium vincentii ATCC 49256]ETT03963.1 PF04239 family protein [Fusobacterium sp. CM21]ALF20237.1 hypothetical protein RN99_07090 [Fusobacterium vincentii ChDC F8]EEO41236.1 hypothetical protein FSCG_01949 [Fusobacterium vincentii 4_1_13]EFG35339.1 hypothetical protein HMPREF0405_01623 [Fusobacterium vincentii 3_1_27]
MELSYLDIAIKLTMGLLSLVFVINISGKGNLAPSSATDQVLNYVLGGIVGGVIYSPRISVLQYFIILMIWTMIVLILKWLKTNSVLFKSILDGQPVIIIKKGILDVEACRRAGLTANDIAFKLRTNGVYSVKKVKRAVLEQNGQLIIVLQDEENPKYPIITDGTVQTNILEAIDKDTDWLQEQLKEMGYENISDIFLAEYDNGKINVITY